MSRHRWCGQSGTDMTMFDDARMAALLGVVQDGDDSGSLADNSIIAARLGWQLEDVAACLNEAKDRSLVWGRRSGDKPAPWFSELEITVQGRRLLRPHSHADHDPIV
jgi:hypothetical protein